jgi:hypothetical protein
MVEAGQKDEKQLPEVRKPYSAPKLRRLGSVRDLNLGTRNGKPEGVGRKPPGGG